MSKDALKKAIEIAGGQLPLAREIGTGQATIWKWLNRSAGPVPTSRYVLAIERATGVSRQELRPDLYPVEEAA